MKINRTEVLRYMSWRKGEPNEAIMSLVERICTEFEQTVTPRYTKRKATISTANNMLFVDGIKFESEKLSNHLNGVKEGIVIAATLGAQADNIIRKETVLGTLNASIAQATGAAMIEDFLDDVGKRLEREYNVSFLSRFSPGYGDWSLKSQSEMLYLTDAEKQLGITLTESYMMIPTKSVTALIGFGENFKNETHNCESCSKKDCEFRK